MTMLTENLKSYGFEGGDEKTKMFSPKITERG